MHLTNTELKYRRLLCGRTALYAVILFTLNALILWLDAVISGDVLMRDGFLPALISWLSILIPLAGFALFYGGSVYAVYAFGFSGSVPVFLTVIGCTLYQYLTDALAHLCLIGIDETDFLLYELPGICFSLGMELLQYGVILLIAFLCLRRVSHTVSLPGNAGDRTHGDVSRNAFPFRKWLDFKNPVLRTLFLTSFTVMVIQLISRVIYDIGYGAPSSTKEVLSMIFAYASDILLYGVALYFVTRFLTSRMNKSRMELNINNSPND